MAGIHIRRSPPKKLCFCGVAEDGALSLEEARVIDPAQLCIVCRRVAYEEDRKAALHLDGKRMQNE
jgi:hypothetical protein